MEQERISIDDIEKIVNEKVSMRRLLEKL